MGCDRERQGKGGSLIKPAAKGMESLPPEIILNILSRLPSSSLVQSKFVCPLWRTLLQDPQLLDMRYSRWTENDPCLIFHSDYHILNHLWFADFSTCNNERYAVKSIYSPFLATLPEFDVVGSCNGLLCLSDQLHINALCICNPFSLDCIELPKSMQYPNQEVVFGFGFHSTTKEYRVVRVIYYRDEYNGIRRGRPFRLNRQSDVQILNLGSPTWRSIGKLSYNIYSQRSQVFMSGRLHWVTWPRRYGPGAMIISFDLADEQFREVPRPACGGLDRCLYHLVVLGGCLSAAVYFNYLKLEIWVMKDYDVKESWTKQFIIESYYPKDLNQNAYQSCRNSRIARKEKFVRVLCLLKNGEILLEYKSTALVAYDPKHGTFKDLMFQRMPNSFRTIVHNGCLNWVDIPNILRHIKLWK